MAEAREAACKAQAELVEAKGEAGVSARRSELLGAAKNGETAKLVAQITEADGEYAALEAKYAAAVEAGRRDEAARAIAEKGQVESEVSVALAAAFRPRG